MKVQARLLLKGMQHEVNVCSKCRESMTDVHDKIEPIMS